MKAQEFAKFVASQQSEVGSNERDLLQIREEWLRDLDSLYRNIEDFLKEFVTRHSVSCGFSDITLIEEGIGIYQARRMEIKIGRQHVLLEPIGTLLIGFKGRVDVLGSMGRAQLFLVDRRVRSAVDLVKVTVGLEGKMPDLASSSHDPISWAWKIVSPKGPTRFVDLDKESFFDLLVEVAGA